MNLGIKQYVSELGQAWDRFWFTPGRPQTLCLIRICAGLMLVYTHLVWTIELPTFFAADGVFSDSYRATFDGESPFIWSHFNWSDSPLWIWGSHWIALTMLLAFTVGLWTRWTSILAFLIVVSYAHRAGGALFGLDQINGFLALYLAVGPSGQCYSVDAWLRSRTLSSSGSAGTGTKRAASKAGKKGQGSGRKIEPFSPSITCNLSIRLIQLHLCVVYLFAGLGKLQGVTWWNGTAIWGALASHEYQTLDMTWMVHLPWLVNVVTLVSVFWELSYPFLIWNRLARPVYLALAVMVHLGIGLAMGMMTFGLIMLVANLAFVSPDSVSRLIARIKSSLGIARSAATSTAGDA